MSRVRIPVVQGPSGRAMASVLAGALCLSVSAVLIKLAGVDSATTAVLRCVIAVLVLAPLAMHESRRRGAMSVRGIGWALAAGCALGADYSAWTASIFYVGAGVSTVLINVQVIVLPALAFLVDREKVTTRYVLTAPLMLLGISLVGGLWDAGPLGSRAVTGTLLGAFAGIGYAIYLFLSRRGSRLDPGRVIQPVTWATAGAAITSAALSPLSGGIHLTGISARSWVLLVTLAVTGQVVAWLFVQHGSVQLPPTVTAALLLAQPVLAMAIAAVLVDEHPTARQLLGAAVVIGSVAVANGVLRAPWKALRTSVLGRSRKNTLDSSTCDAAGNRPLDTRGDTPPSVAERRDPVCAVNRQGLSLRR